MVKLGWKVTLEKDPLALLDMAFCVEQAGFDFIDFCNPSLAEGNPLRAATNWSWLGAAAAKTRQMFLGTCIPSSIFRSDPAVIAETLQILAAISSDRVSLTILVEDENTGLVEYWKDQNQQQDILSEGIELVRALWGCETVAYNGHYYHARKPSTENPIKQPAPLYLAVQKPGSAFAAGYSGDGVVVMGGVQANVCRRILDEFNRGAVAAGKNPEQMTRMVELPVIYALGEEPEWIAVEDAWTVDWLDLEIGEDVFIPVTADGRFRSSAGVDQHNAYASDDPNCHAAYAQSFIDLGFNHLLFDSRGVEMSGLLEAYARDIMPRIRASNVAGGM